MHFSELIKSLQTGNAELEDYQVCNDPELSSGASLEKAHSNQLTFLEVGNQLVSKLSKTQAGAILIPPREELIKQAKKINLPWAVLKNPRLGFAESLGYLHPKIKISGQIHPTAVLGDNVILGKDVYLGANVCIGDNCEIRANSIIHPGVMIYDNVLIEKECELHANCVIHAFSIINKKCIINSNAVIGSEGFGFVPTKNGWYKMPQTGIVVLEEEVEIGTGTTIDRPSVGETRIGQGTKIDNLVQIGHGVITGKDCAIAAQVGIAGGAQLGNGVILAGQVGVGNRVKIGDHVIASSKSGINSDIAPNQVVSGFPAIPNKLWLRCSASFKKLPEITKAIRELNRLTSN